MAVLNLLELQPTVVTRDLRGKFLCLYGDPGAGKTSFLISTPGSLIVGFEHGWNARSNVFAVDVATWADFKSYIKQLKKPEMKEKFQVIGIDTVGIAWDRCTDYICDKENIDKISDLPYGQGYKEVEKEFEKTIVELTQLGYGIIFIAHSQARTELDPDNENAEINIIGPAIPNKPYAIINRLVDITAYITIDKDGSRWMNYRRTPTYFAKTRFTYMPDRTSLDYNSFITALSDAIEEEANHGGKVVDKVEKVEEKKTLSFEELIAEIKKYAKVMNANDLMNDYTKITTEYLGKGKNVKDCTESQTDMLVLILDDLKDYFAEHNLSI